MVALIIIGLALFPHSTNMRLVNILVSNKCGKITTGTHHLIPIAITIRTDTEPFVLSHLDMGKILHPHSPKVSITYWHGVALTARC
jgi:hypothetical protein